MHPELRARLEDHSRFRRVEAATSGCCGGRPTDSRFLRAPPFLEARSTWHSTKATEAGEPPGLAVLAESLFTAVWTFH
jgi:hypothetical protein